MKDQEDIAVAKALGDIARDLDSDGRHGDAYYLREAIVLIERLIIDEEFKAEFRNMKLKSDTLHAAADYFAQCHPPQVKQCFYEGAYWAARRFAQALGRGESPARLVALLTKDYAEAKGLPLVDETLQ